MSEGKTNRIASLTAKSLKSYLGEGGEKRDVRRGKALHSGPRVETHLPWDGTRTRTGGRGAQAKTAPGREAPKSSALKAPSQQRRTLSGLKPVHSTPKPTGLALYSLVVAPKGPQKDCLGKKKWCRVLPHCPIADRPPAAAEGRGPSSPWKLAASSPGSKDPSPQDPLTCL